MPNTNITIPAMRITAAFILVPTEVSLLFLAGIGINTPDMVLQNSEL
jgi:hypothetical protein